MVLLVVATGRAAWAQDTPVTVGIVLDAPAQANALVLAAFQKELVAAAQGAFNVVCPPEKTLTADGTQAGIAAALDSLLADTSVGLVLALGPLVSAETARRTGLSKPVVAPFVADADLQGLPRLGDASGLANLNYITRPPGLARELIALRQFLPLDRVTVLGDVLACCDLARVQTCAAQAGGESGVEVRLVPIDTAADVALAALPADGQAVYLGPMPRLSQAEFDRLVAGLNERKLPTVSMRGREDVVRGVFLGLASGQPVDALARQAARNLLRILQGEAAASLPVLLIEDESPVINMATARALGVAPAPEMMIDAELLNETPVSAPIFGLSEAVDAALGASPILKGAQQQIEAAQEEVREAKTSLLPQAEVGAKAAPPDPERIRLGLPQEPDLVGAAGVSQVIFSEKALADVQVRRKNVEREEHDHRLAVLEAAFDTASVYLSVLEAESLERLQRDDLRLTRAYLGLARMRQARGVAGPDEVHRWESKQATARKDAIAAQEQVRIAKVALNRALHRAQDQPVAVAASGLDDPMLLGGYRKVLPYLESPEAFEALSGFLVAEGTKAAPELLKYAAEIAAKERAALAARREFYTPTVTVRGEVSQGFDDEERARRPEPTRRSFSLVPETEEADWDVGIHATLPIGGGAKRSARGKVNAELEKLRLERRDAEEGVEQRIRSALLKARASYTGVPQAQEAALAARKGLDRVALAYEQGTAGAADLLDAQNAALVAEQAATRALAESLVDLLRVQRASAHFDFLMSEYERENWYERLDAFVRTARAKG